MAALARNRNGSNQNLSLDSHMNSIYMKIRSTQSLELQIPRGFGKTTVFPVKLAEKTEYKNQIFVVLPNNDSVVSTATLVKSYFPNIAYLNVGYANLNISGKRKTTNTKYNSSDIIVYTSVDFILYKLYSLLRNGDIQDWNFGVVMILDDIDLNLAEQNLIIRLWKLCLNNNKKVPRLVLTGAAIYFKQYSYLNSSKYVIRSNEPELKFHNSSYFPLNPQLVFNMAEKIMEFHSSSYFGQTYLAIVGNDNMAEFLKSKLNIENANIIILTNRSDVSKIPSSTATTRTIVITHLRTNVPNVSLVIDSGVIMRTQQIVSGGTRYELVRVCSSEINTRASIAKQESYVMMTKQSVVSLPEFYSDELIILPIYDFILDMLYFNIPTEMLGEIFGKGRILSSISTLISLGMVTPKTRSSPISVTEIGNYGKYLEYSIYNRACLYWWMKQDSPNFLDGVILLSLIDTYDNGYFRLSSKKSGYSGNKNKEIKKVMEKFGEYSDVGTLIRLWSSMMSSIGGNIRRIRGWSRENHVDQFKISKVIANIENVYTTLGKKLNRRFNSNSFGMLLIGVFRPIFSHVFGSLTLTLNESELTYSEDNLARSSTSRTESGIRKKYILNNFNAINGFSSYPPEIMIPVLSISRPRSQKNVIVIGLNETVQQEKKYYQTEVFVSQSVEELDEIRKNLAQTLNFEVETNVEDKKEEIRNLPLPPVSEDLFEEISYGPNGFFVNQQKEAKQMLEK